jgi:hypothetical protein
MSYQKDKHLQIVDEFGLEQHCKVAALILKDMEINPHTKHHIRSALREASLKVTPNKGTNKDKATLMSEKSLKQMKTGDKKELYLEHIVPVSVINECVLKLNNPTWKQISEIIIEWTILAIITKDENKVLRDQKLSKTMPHTWDGVDKLARYKCAKIKLIPSQYKKFK